MKTYINNFKHLCTLLLTALAFVACSSDNDDIATPEPVQPANGDITFTAVFGVKNATTRALSDPGNGTLTASWQVGEEIAIVFGGNKYVATVTELDGDGSAIVSATLPSGTPNNQAVTFIYPASAADGSGLLSDLLATQDGTLATLSSTLDVATADGNIVIDGTNAQPNGTVTLVNQFAICKFQFTDEDDHAIEDIEKLVITDLSTTEKITVETPSAQPAVYVAIKPSNNSMRFELLTGSNAYMKTASAHLEAGMFYQPTFKAIKDHMYVDLGLPSGTLWATCNIGANSPEEYGDFFAWGETEPKDEYSWSTYKHCAGDVPAMTKYCTSRSIGYNSFTDGLTELLPEDDAATVNWNSYWQMPSNDQLTELVNNTTAEWTTLNSVNGRLLTASNGKSIFLPASGYYWERGHDNTTRYGYGWSRSLNTENELSGGCLYLSLYGIGAGSSTRYYGNPIRPVRKQ